MAGDIEDYLNVRFQSSTTLTPEFERFSEDFKIALQQRLPEPYKIINYSMGHFNVSGFISTKWCQVCNATNIPEGCPNYMRKMVGSCNGPAYVYFSILDVRHNKDEWYHNILVRTAKSPEDYTGGSNGYTTVNDFGKDVRRLMEWQLGGQIK